MLEKTCDAIGSGRLPVCAAECPGDSSLGMKAAFLLGAWVGDVCCISGKALFRAKRIASLSEVRPKCALRAAMACLSCSEKRIVFAFCIP